MEGGREREGRRREGEREREQERGTDAYINKHVSAALG